MTDNPFRRREATLSLRRKLWLNPAAVPSSPARADSSKCWGVLFGATVFCAAFLVFLVQPLVGRLLLPVYGGAPAVWSTCLVFFECTLFVGYLIAHAVTLWLPWRAQRVLQVGLAAAAILALPFSAPHAPSFARGPQQQVLWWLIVQVALPFAALCTAAPTLQRWWNLCSGREPFKLYAVSNAGSLLALLVYPLFVEPRFTLKQQSGGWAVAFAGTVVAFATCAWHTRHGSAARQLEGKAPLAWRTKLLWLCLAAVPSVMLLAVTNHITIDVASAPLLWVVPLFLYLLSFVLVFGPLGHRGQSLWLLLWIVATAALGMNLFLAGQASVVRQVLVASAVLFSTCMLCHGEMLRHRPDAAWVTSFYLWMAAGGALGGVFAGLIAPQVFRGFLELQTAVVGTVFVLWCSGRIYKTRARLLYLAVGVSLPLMSASWWLGTATQFKDATVLFRERSFFGLIQVTRFPKFTVLTSGRIRHGMQWNDTGLAPQPTMYFAPSTAVGTVLSSFMPKKHRRLGILGLGVGTLAAYARSTDDVWFYELDPVVVNAARERFTFLSSSHGATHVVVGDGRLALAADEGAPWDVLVLDAFSSDAVPSHLLTREAFAIYDHKLARGGVLLANVSNRHLQVERVVAGAAQALGWPFALYETSTDLSRGITRVRWVVMARSRRTLDDLGLRGALPLPGPPVLWTDDRSSLLPILRLPP
ncbi:MAG: fused MFS/spermidine synthase [Deltaproteobacteria bacterium]|nr:fused MFS/spermidine synthase [Deltaproteobacteria bacterium]